MKIWQSISRIVLVPLTLATVGVVSSQVALADATNAVPPPGSGQLATPMTPGLPFGASEVVKMYQGGIGKDVIINYVNNAVLPFHLTADNIIYLQSLGVPQEITKAVIVRDGQLQQQATMYAQQMAMSPANQMGAAPPPTQEAPVATPSTPPPDIGYPYDYSAAGYPYYYGGYPYYVGGGWWPGWYGGWGYRGGYGFRGGFGGGRGGFGGFHGGPAIRGGGGFGGGHGGGGFGGHGGGGHR
jgi:hypothetical protein